ncbi:glycosyltransferase family 4 protein [Streptomyces tropicalis]|uniref:MraY family glycosyltransferase n=1 Tax=Streptomyces tropicalis TaxID=3034234 RepID=A0ABT5ZZ04_9ACTN|nr:MraY family glycosyltransferase [Streptomyces tropicalis]MDF3297624.1 MraY family glycosyltransferase [Streptomyces tropicalis]
MDTQVVTAGAGGVALLIGLLLTEPLRRFALRRGIADLPSARKSHTRPTPYLGGVAVAVATLAAGAVAARVVDAWDPALNVVLGGAGLMCVLGLVDDLRPLSPRLRLGIETTAAVVVVLAGGHPTVLGGPFDVVFAVVWIVFVTNAFNLLDNMDGAATSLCVVIGGCLCVTALAAGSVGLGVTMAALAGSCLGFLYHNRHPARIFLGDAGSLFLGFTLSSTMVVVHDDVQGLSGPAGLLLVGLVPTVDTTLVMLSRYLESRPLMQGGTDHIAHRLRRLGMTVHQVVRSLNVLAVAGCVAAMLVAHGFLAPGTALDAACVVGVGAVLLLLGVPSGATLLPPVRPAAGGIGFTLRVGPGARATRLRSLPGPLAVPQYPARKAAPLSPATGSPVV